MSSHQTKRVRKVIQGTHVRVSIHLLTGVGSIPELEVEKTLCHLLEQVVLEWCNVECTQIMLTPWDEQKEIWNGLVLLTQGIYKPPVEASYTVEFQDEVLSRRVVKVKTIRYDLPSTKNPFKIFLREFKPSHRRMWLKYPSEEESWQQINMELAYLEEFFVKQLSEEELKAHLLQEMGYSEIIKKGKMMLENVQIFAESSKTKCSIEEEKGVFPFWCQTRLNYLTTGVKRCSCDQEDFLCLQCHEIKCLQALEWWYQNVFVSAGVPQNNDDECGFIRSDMVKVRSTIPARLKGLVIRSERESGKTLWFYSICNGNANRIAHFKNRFTAGTEIQKLKEETAWLILCDDFSEMNAQDAQTFKSLIAGSPTTIQGKWLAYEYKGGIPCVWLCNSQKMFDRLYADPDVRSQCLFIDLEELFIGPPGSKSNNSKMELESLNASRKKFRTTL